MSRFNNLEIGQVDRKENQGDVVRDEAWHLAEAANLYQSGRYDLALRSYSRVLEHNSSNAHAWCSQVRMLVELGEYREAKLWVDKALERFPKDPELLAAKAVVLARTGEFGAALAFSDAAFEERGDSPHVWLARGEVLLSRDDSGAPYCFERALSLGPRDWMLHWLAARIHAFYRRFAQALAHARRAVELAPERAVAWLEVARHELALGLSDQARRSLAQATQIDGAIPGAQQLILDLADTGPFSRLLRRLRSPFA